MKKYYKSHITKIILYLLAVIINAVTVAITGFVFAALTNAALGSDFKTFVYVAIFSMIFLIIDCYFDFLPRFLKSKLINAILHSLREDLISHYLKEDLYYVMTENPSKRIDNLVNQIEVIENSYLKPLCSIVSCVFIFLFSLIGAIYLQGILTVIMLILCFLPFLAPVINRRILSDKKQEAQNAKKQYLEKFDSFSRHLSIIRLARASTIFSELLGKESMQVNKNIVAYEKAQSKTYSISNGLCNIVYSGMWIIGGIFVFYKLLSVPALVAMTTLTSTIAGPIQSISDYIADFVSGRKVTKEFLLFLNNNEETKTYSQDVMKTSIKSISFCDVHYSIGNHILFDTISISFYKGKKYILTGDSGSGKSTLLQMLMGIIPCKNGCIKINDKDLLTIDKNSYYKYFTYVPQKTAIFNATIADNISMFQNINEKKIVKSLIKAGLSDWFSKQENGIYTIISENQLSGGEERRLDIARSLYRETEMIIMDEPTSGLDEKNEQIIASIIDSMNDKIIIVVTHSTNQSFLSIFDKEIRISNQQLTSINL